MLAPAVTGILARALGDPDPLPEGTEQPLARTAAGVMVDTLAENAGDTLSKTEDADLTELITKLAQQELAYQAVLKSSSTVMNLSLVSYI